MLHRNILNDYQSRLHKYLKERDKLEASFIEKAYVHEMEDFFPLSSETFQLCKEMTAAWIEKIQKFFY